MLLCLMVPCRFYWLNVVIMGLGLVAYVWIARAYTEKPIIVLHKKYPPAATSDSETAGAIDAAVLANELKMS
jgi:hypothetical protein